MGRLPLCMGAAAVLLIIVVESRTIDDSVSGVSFDVELEDSGDNAMRSLRERRAASWRVANSLITFRNQLNRAYPSRSKGSDGFIGDAAHQSRTSDHNPWVRWNGQPIVTAGDFTKDVRAGVDTDRITDELQRSRDNRIKYVIANGYIMSGDQGPQPWVWRRKPNGGDYGHHHHMHISVKSDARYGDDSRAWNIPSFGR